MFEPNEEDPKSALRYASDFAVYKPRADLLLLGTAHAPDGLAVPSIDVAFRVESFVKPLRIVGERAWHQTEDGTIVSSPDAVTSMPITQIDHAFGGPNYPRNPMGRGYQAANAPNVENPQRPVRGPDDAAEPSGFAPLSSAWEPRSVPGGTYDDAWLKDRWPWFPMDFDWGIFQRRPTRPAADWISAWR